MARKKQEIKQNTFSTTEVIVILFLSIAVSLTIGSLVTYNLNKNKNEVTTKEFKKFIDNYNYINNNYYKKVDKDKLIDGAISGMLSSLGDDYSYLIDDESSENFDIRLEGEYEGIGVEIISTDEEIIINRVFKDSPAEKAGLKSGDIILKIDNKEYGVDETNELASYIRKNEKKDFDVTIKRKNRERTFTITKSSVTIESVIKKIFKKNKKKIGYLYISIFSNSSTRQFKEELEELEKENIDSLIIDVRDNSGGRLTTATGIISLFLNSKHVIYQTDTKGTITKYYSTGKKTKDYPIVVLQNSNSASASEMLSAALKEEYKATIVGETSYGKGTVQELLELGKNVEYKITTKKWLTPKGHSIDKKGVSVDYEVELDDEYKNDPSEENDNQLQKALEVISEK